MTKLISLLSVLALASCGDNIKTQSDAHMPDGATPIPAVPSLGTQMDRMGRPAINTALNHAFDGTAAAATAKDAYNVDGSPGGWQSAYTGAFAASLGFIDVLDTGFTCTTDGTGVCTANNAAANGAGCGNQVMYNATLGGGGAPTAQSYTILAAVLADDELYLDTTKTSCDLPNHANYLAVEFSALSPVPNVTCGGRAPTNDVMDTSYTALAFGVNGFNLSDFSPFFGDGVGPHADVNNDTFPFLGAPH